jgi:hypothetical protein
VCLLALGLLTGCGSGAVSIDGPSLSGRAEARCRALVDALPSAVDDQEARAVSPDDALGAAWGDPAIVLTCGVGRPKGYVPEASCTVVNGVGWFIPDDQMQADGAEDLTMTTLFRDVDVEVRLPKEYFPPAAALADLSTAVKKHTTASESCL